MAQWHHFDQPIGERLGEGKAQHLLTPFVIVTTGADHVFGGASVKATRLHGSVKWHPIVLLPNQLPSTLNHLTHLLHAIHQRVID